MTEQQEWSDDDSVARAESKPIPPRAAAAIKAARAAATATANEAAAVRKITRER